MIAEREPNSYGFGPRGLTVPGNGDFHLNFQVPLGLGPRAILASFPTPSCISWVCCPLLGFIGEVRWCWHPLVALSTPSKMGGSL